MQLSILGASLTHNVLMCENITDLIICADFLNKFNFSFDTIVGSVYGKNKSLCHFDGCSIKSHLCLTTTIVKTKFNGQTEPFVPHTAEIVKLLHGGPTLV